MKSIPDGYITNPGLDPAEDYVGPFYYRHHEDRYTSAFVPAAKNCNLNGDVHGGVLVTFADFALCVAATDNYAKESCTSISFNCEFVAAGKEGDLIECTPIITRKTGSMVFVTGTLTSSGETLMTFSSVVKRLRPR
ncbi:MAG: PaaI family thioesterase [Pseudomonadales bacterium]|nr:PaaI family thioesterase [Pseudomonadales bacterium]